MKGSTATIDVITIVSRGIFFGLWCALCSDNVIQEYHITGGPTGGGLL